MIFTYSLFIGLNSVTSNMTGYSHSYHLILIHCSAPRRDVLSDKMVFSVMTRTFLFHALPVFFFFIEYCHKLCILYYMKTNGGSMEACHNELFSVWKIFKKELFYSLSTLN